MDGVIMVGRLLVSLAVVLGLMWFLGKRLRKGGRLKSTQLIDVLGRHQLSRNASVAVVRIGEQALVVGVTDAQVSVLGETDLGAALALTTSTGDPRPARQRRTAAARHVAANAPTTSRPVAAPAAPVAAAAAEPSLADITQAVKPGALSGSALSPQTWRQTLDSLRDLTSRQA